MHGPLPHSLGVIVGALAGVAAGVSAAPAGRPTAWALAAGFVSVGVLSAIA